MRTTWMVACACVLWSTAACNSKNNDTDDTKDNDTATATPASDTADTVAADTADDTAQDTTAWDTNHAPDEVASFGPWATPPGDMPLDEVPMFVSIGFDDNGFVDGMEWILDFLKDKTAQDGTPARVSFYVNCGFAWDDPDYTGPANVRVGDGSPPDDLLAVWKRAYEEGHEIGNHTVHHRQAFNFWGSYEKDWTIDDWRYEVGACHDFLVNQVGIPEQDLRGFRAPFLGYNDDLYTVLSELHYDYDCSMEEGWQYDQNGTNFNWPYDLAAGSQVDKIILTWGGNERDPVGSHPGIWEIPVHPVVIPPDYRCAEYGIEPGLRSRLYAVADYFDVTDGKATGLDYNLLDEFPLSGPEIAATLKYTLDLRLRGNRAPMVFGAHTPYYSEENDVTFASPATVAERRAAIEEFLTYALSKPEVRVVPSAAILDWIQAHSAQTDTSATDSDTATDTAADTGSTDTATDTAADTGSTDTTTDSATV